MDAGRVLAGETVGAAGTLAPRVRAPAAALAAALGFLLAALASGLEPRLLAPAHWSELGAGIGRGLEALSGVTLPYAGVDPWPDVTLRLGGALLVTLAAVLAAWPREQGRGFPFFALAALLVLVATPVTAIGSPRSLVLGAALAALTVCFLWLERLPLRPGLGVAVLAGVALAGALPLGAAADRGGPWFDYSTWAEGLGTPPSARFDWNHSYGPVRWRRDGREMLRIRSRPAAVLEAREPRGLRRPALGRAQRPRRVRARRGGRPGRGAGEHPQWNGEARVIVRGLRGDLFAGAGTTLAVDAGAREATPTFSPGTWEADQDLAAGDSYRVSFHAARPNPLELAAATSGSRGQQGDALTLTLPLLVPDLSPPGERDRPINAVRLELPPFSVEAPPLAENERRGRPGRHPQVAELVVPADVAARAAAQARRPQPLRLHTPHRHVPGARFRYDERPARVPAGVQPLDHFLFEGKAGYCQHFSGAMALLLRMGGVPARVASGFSPGGFRRRQGEWVVRDQRRALVGRGLVRRHRLGDVRPDAGRDPRRSLIASISAPDRCRRSDAADDAAAGPRPRRNSAGPPGAVDQPRRGRGGGDSGGDGGPAPWIYVAGGLALLAVAAALVLWRRRRRGSLAPADRAIADLVVALRRAGRPVPPGVTLTELERRLGGAGYLSALRSARYGATASPPTPDQRRAFRRELAAGLGWRGRLRAWWALPPTRR